MSMLGSQHGVGVARSMGSTKGDPSFYARSDAVQGGGNGYDNFMDGFKSTSYTFTRYGTMGSGVGNVSGGGGAGGVVVSINQRAAMLQNQCNEYLKKAEFSLQSGGSPGDAEYFLGMARESIDRLKGCALDMRQMGQPNESLVQSVEMYSDQLKGVHMALSGSNSLRRRRSQRGSSGGGGGAWEDPGRNFNDAMGWMSQQKRLIETAPWGDDPAAIEQQISSHQRFHSSIQRSSEVDRARDELMKKGDKGNLYALDQEWDTLQQMSHGRLQQLRELLQIIEAIVKEIMWVNDREEEELVFDWGDKNVEQYVPRKQEAYSKLMSDLEEKERDLNKLRSKVDVLLNNKHPAADKIEAYKDTLQTQWSWLLQITKCIDTHLKENGAYSLFFKEANETYKALQKEHESVRKKFACDKNTPLESLQEMLANLEKEKEKIMEHKRHVQHLVSKSRSIVRLKPRNPDDKSSSGVVVKALCDFKQDQKVICKNNEAILKDNGQRSKWLVTGPGGLDMLVPSVCLIVPPPNPLSVSLANKNEQYYEAILSIWNQLVINVKSLVAWQYCTRDIQYINSLTLSVLSRMRPEEYRQIFKNLESHYDDFILHSNGSQMFVDEDKRSLEQQFTHAQTHYDKLLVQLPTYVTQQQEVVEEVVEEEEEEEQEEDPQQQQLLLLQLQQEQQRQQLIILQQQQEQQQLIIVQEEQEEEERRSLQEERRLLEEERRRAELRKQAAKKEASSREHVSKKEVVRVPKTEPPKKKVPVPAPSAPPSHSLSELHALRLRLEAIDGMLSQHVHICIGEDGVKDCGVRITQLESLQRDMDSVRQQFVTVKERVMKELQGMCDADKSQFLRDELGIIDQRLDRMQGLSASHAQRLRALRDLLDSLSRAEDTIKVHEARLTEKETTSLSPQEVQEHSSTLENMKAELEQKKDVLASMEAELVNTSQWDAQVGGPFHRCDLMLSKYKEEVGLLSDRWRRILGQIDTRLRDMQLYLPQLQHYQQTSSELSSWIDETRRKQDEHLAAQIDSVQGLKEHMDQQKALNAEIIAKRATVDCVLKDIDACVLTIRDYESDVASYTSGLETLLNIPIRRTMLRSPAMDLNHEAVQLQTRYMELLTQSTDYYKFLGALLKNMEELKIRNTRIELLEEELRLLKEGMQDNNDKNKSMEEALARYKLELSQSQDQLLSMQEVKQSSALQYSTTKRDLDDLESQLGALKDEVANQKALVEEERRKRKLAEERYDQLSHDHDLALKVKQSELETISWSKQDLEKSIANKDRELELLRRQLEEEAAKVNQLQKEISQMKAAMLSLQSQYNSLVSEKDALLLEFQSTEKNQGPNKQLEEELLRIKLSSESDLRDNQRLQEENERMKMDVKYWKDQCESKQEIIKQCDADKEGLERDKQSLKSELERLMKELRGLEESYKSKLVSIQNEMQKVTIAKQTMETQLKQPREPPGMDASTLIFDGVRKSVTADQLLDCGVLDKQTFELLVKRQRTVPELSTEKRVHLKGTGPIAGVVIENPESSDTLTTPFYKLTITEAKNENLLPPECADMLLDAQAATGHIIDARTNQKFTVDEACNQSIVDDKDKKRLLAAEAAAVGYTGHGRTGPLSVFQAMDNGMIDKEQALRLLQAQESVGGIIDPTLSVFLPKDTAVERKLIDNSVIRALNQKPKLYLDPETEENVTYDSIKKRCKVDPSTGLLLLPVSERIDPSKLVFDGVRKPVTARQLLECQVLEKTVFRDLEKGKKSVPEISEKKKTPLKGTGPIAGVIAGSQGKLSLSEAKKQMLLPQDVADQLLEAQAATGHIIDPQTNQKMTVEEACIKEVVDLKDRDKLLAAEAAAIGYKDPCVAKPISVFEAMNKGMVDKDTGLRLLQAQESVGGILDPHLSVFLPKETAIKRKLIDEKLNQTLNQDPQCYLDPDTECDISYGMLKNRCMTEPHTGLLLLPISERVDPSKLIFDGVRKTVTAKELLDCGVLDDHTFTQLVKGQKTIEEVSEVAKVPLKGTGAIAGVTVGPLGKMSLSEAKNQMLMPTESANYLLEAQAATGHIIDPMSNQKLTVQEALARRVVDIKDRDKLFTAEAAATGFQDPNTGEALSVFQAMKKGMIDRKMALRLLQAQESAGGILDPNLSVFLPQDEAMKRNLLDNDLKCALNQSPSCYLDPDNNSDVSYETLKKKCTLEYRTGLTLLPVVERKDPNKLMFDGVRKMVSAQQLFDCGILNKLTFNKLLRGEKTIPEVSEEKIVYLKGTGPIAGVVAGAQGKMSFSDAKKQNIVQQDTADLLLEAQAATGHIIDPKTDQKLTVEEACAKGVVDVEDKSELLTAEKAAVGFRDPRSNKLLSVFEAMKRGLVDEKTTLRLLQAQESVGGILDPNLSVFLPKDIALKRNLIDENLHQVLSRGPPCYLDPDVQRVVSYGTLKKRCKTDPYTDLQILPVTEKMDPSNLLFEGVRRSVNAQQLLDCGVIDKTLFTQLIKGEKSVKDVSVDKRVFLKGTESIAGLSVGPSMKMSFTEAKNQKLISPESADQLLIAQAATGYIIDPRTNQKLNVKEACAKQVVNKEDESMLFAAEGAAIGYRESNTSKLLSVGQAYKTGLIDKDTALQLLQAQEAVGGILDPVLSLFLPKDIARSRDLIDDDLSQALNQSPGCYTDPDTQQSTTYVCLKKKCKPDPSTGLLLLPEPRKPSTVQGLRGKVSVIDLAEANLLKKSDMDQLYQGLLTSKNVEERLRTYLRGSSCIAGVYDETSEKVLSIYQALKEGLLQPGTALELLEAQAASGFIVDPINNLHLTVDDAYDRGLFGAECKDSLLEAEKAVTGYKVPGSNKLISLFQAIGEGLVDKCQGIKLLGAQLASGGIIDPVRSHRVDMNIAYRRGLLDTKTNEMLTNPSAETRNYFDPNADEKLTYSELKTRCTTDKKTGLILLPLMDQKNLESIRQNRTRRRRVVIVDPDTNKEMTVREAYNKGYIDRETYIELSQQECEWEEITITDPDGTVHIQIIDKGSGRQYNISDLLDQGVIDQSTVEAYRSRKLTLTQFADLITEKTQRTPQLSSSSSSSSYSSTKSSRPSAAMATTTTTSTLTSSTSLQKHSGTSSTSKTLDSSDPGFVSMSVSSISSRSLSPSFSKTTKQTTTIREESSSFSSSSPGRDSPDSAKHFSSISVSLGYPLDPICEQEPVGAIFDSDSLEKITITEAMNRGLVDIITAQRLLEAQACTGGIIDPANGRRVGIQEACRMGLIDEDMATKLKPAQKAYFGYEDVKTKRKMSAAEAMKEMWLPYEAGQRFLEFQAVTGGLYDPENNCRKSIEEALKLGWLDVRGAQRLANVKNHSKNLTCPKSKLKISYKEALDNCLAEEDTGVRMLHASSISSKGISSPYNVGSTPGSQSGSRSGSHRGSRRGSLDMGVPTQTVTTRYTTFSTSTITK